MPAYEISGVISTSANIIFSHEVGTYLNAKGKNERILIIKRCTTFLLRQSKKIIPHFH